MKADMANRKTRMPREQKRKIGTWAVPVLFALFSCRGAESTSISTRSWSNIDESGNVHERTELVLSGVRVIGPRAIVHRAPDGSVKSQTPMPDSPGLEEEAPAIDEKTATSLALARFSGRRLEKRQAALEYRRIGDRFRLVYEIELRSNADPGVSLLVSAQDGEVLAIEELARHGYANTAYHGPIELPTSNDGHGHATLVTPIFNTYITTRSYYSATNEPWDELHPDGYPLLDEDDAWGDGAHHLLWSLLDNSSVHEAAGQTQAAEAHYAALTTDAFFRSYAIDGATARHQDITLIAHAPWPSFTDTVARRVFVGGSQVKVCHPQSTLDIVGHEIGHIFFANTVTRIGNADLETRAIDEGNSDIIGEMVEASTMLGIGEPDWLVGAQMCGGRPIYYFRTPNKDGHSYNAWSPSFQTDATIDPHYAAGPIRRVFYFLATGVERFSQFASNDGASPYLPTGMAGLGRHRATRVWLRTMKECVAGWGFIGFKDLREAMIGCNLREGVETVHAIEDAFAAINVGAPADREPPTITLNATFVNERLRLSGSATDPRGVHQAIKYFVDGSLVHEETANTYGTNISFSFDFDHRSLAPGVHSARVEIRDGSENVGSASKSFDVSRPSFGALTQVGPKKTPTIDVRVIDPAGVARVELLPAAGIAPQLRASPPYAFPVSTAQSPDGLLPLRFVATNTTGVSAETTYLLRVDNTAPSVELLVTNDQSPFLLAATATDVSPLVAARFSKDGEVLSTSTTAPFSGRYTPTDGREHTLSVEIDDDFGNIGRTTIPAPKDTVPPSVTRFDTRQWGPPVFITFEQSDPCGVGLYRVFIDDELSLIIDAPMLELPLPWSLTPGNHVFRAEMQDRCGNTAVFERSFSKYFTPPGEPTTTIDYTTPKQPVITIDAFDDQGIHHVDLLKEGVVIGTSDDEPYRITIDTSTWTGPSQELQVIAWDLYGWPASTRFHVRVDNTGPVFQVRFSGAGHGAYTFVVANASDTAGIRVARFAAWPAPWVLWQTVLAEDLAAPYTYSFWIPESVRFSGSMGFSAELEDGWGNVRQLQGTCAVDTETSVLHTCER